MERTAAERERECVCRSEKTPQCLLSSLEKWRQQEGGTGERTKGLGREGEKQQKQRGDGPPKRVEVCGNFPVTTSRACAPLRLSPAEKHPPRLSASTTTRTRSTRILHLGPRLPWLDIRLCRGHRATGPSGPRGGAATRPGLPGECSSAPPLSPSQTRRGAPAWPAQPRDAARTSPWSPKDQPRGQRAATATEQHKGTKSKKKTCLVVNGTTPFPSQQACTTRRMAKAATSFCVARGSLPSGARTVGSQAPRLGGPMQSPLRTSLKWPWRSAAHARTCAAKRTGGEHDAMVAPRDARPGPGFSAKQDSLG